MPRPWNRRRISLLRHTSRHVLDFIVALRCRKIISIAAAVMPAGCSRTQTRFRPDEWTLGPRKPTPGKTVHCHRDAEQAPRPSRERAEGFVYPRSDPALKPRRLRRVPTVPRPPLRTPSLITNAHEYQFQEDGSTVNMFNMNDRVADLHVHRADVKRWVRDTLAERRKAMHQRRSRRRYRPQVEKPHPLDRGITR